MSNKDDELNHDLSKEDFINSNWKTLIKDKPCKNCSDMWGVFAKEAKKEYEKGNLRNERMYWLLSSVCSMMLQHDNINEPYKPCSVWGSKKSELPQDYTEYDIEFFKSIVDVIDNYILKARIADLLWLVCKENKFEYAILSIESYIKYPIDYESLLDEGNKTWHRGIVLCRLIGKSAEKYLLAIRKIIFEEFKRLEYKNNLHLLWLSKLLVLTDVCDNQLEVICEKLEEFGKISLDNNDWIGRHYLEETINCLVILKKIEDVNRIKVLIAESWVKEADCHPAHMAKGTFLENALKIYRNIPRSSRKDLSIEDRIDEIRNLMNESNLLTLEEMHTIRTESIDISKEIQKAIKVVEGKSMPSVLFDFAKVGTGINVTTLKESVKVSLEKYPLHSLFQSRKFDHEGRVVYKGGGLKLFDLTNDEDDDVLNERMIEEYNIHLQFEVKSAIMPAMDVIIKEHYLTLDEILYLCSESTFVQRDRIYIWAKGLHSGFEKDFLISSHLLIPQIENFVRLQLKIKGENTSTIDKNGIENESGLSTLMENNKIGEIFGEDLSFEIKTLLTSHFGSNLRNQIAHGLLNANHFNSYATIYFWWLCLRFTIFSIPWMHNEDDKK